MTNGNCELEMKEQDGALEIILKGEIDHHSAVRIRSDIDAYISQNRPTRTVMDLSGIEFMDSSGLGLIMGRYALMQSIGGDLKIKNPNERIVRIFKLAGLERIVDVEGEGKREPRSPENKKRKKQRRNKNEAKGK